MIVTNVIVITTATGSEDHTLDFDGDHEPFAPMVPSGDEDSDSETESEKRNDSDTETE